MDLSADNNRDGEEIDGLVLVARNSSSENRTQTDTESKNPSFGGDLITFELGDTPKQEQHPCEGDINDQSADQLKGSSKTQPPGADASSQSQSATSENPIRTRVIKRLGPEDRKQSASDLQSRLKTRKLLGVGELVGDNGDIYRSKISQLLGINESLYVRLPRGLLLWNTAITMYIYMAGILCLVAPSVGSYIEFGYVTSPSDLLAVRMYGAAMLAFGLLFRGMLVLKDARAEISTLLLACATLFSLQLIVGVLHGHLNCALAAFRAAGIIGSLVYQSLLDTQGGVYRQVVRYFDETFRRADHSPSRSSSSDEKEKMT